MGVSKRQVRGQLSIGRQKLGVATLGEVWLLAKEHVEGNLHWLPLTGRIRKRSAARPGRPILTAAQSSLLATLRDGAAPKQAAAELGISENTAYVQLKNCRDRLGVGSNEEAVRKAQDLGLIG
jgi:DNA-binding CsgD family transcriptional regulator